MHRIHLSLVVLATCGWSVEAAELIAPIRAKATSAQVNRLFGPENLCTDVGLTDIGGGRQTLTTNSYTGGGCMWQTGYIALGADEHPVVEFDLGKVRMLAGFHVWNHNGAPHRGFREVSMLVSDDGKTWRPLGQRFRFAAATGKDDYTGEGHQFQSAVKARHVRFICEATHRGGGQRDLAGLGKVRFALAQPGSSTREVKIGGDVFPEGAGVINVREAPYHARGDGRTDDTQAIQKAIDDWQGSFRTILLPAGTYLVSKPLRYQPGKGYGHSNLRGADRQTTILKLKDGVFRDAKNPQPVLSLGFNGRPDGSGVHADWFNNNVSDLTVDSGRNNPGAIGLQYYSNNVGSLRRVNIVSGDRQGAVGLDLGHADQNGPCLVQHVSVEGFALGVSTGATVNSQTLEHITIRHAARVGWENRGQCLAIRGLRISDSGPGLVSQFGVVALVDAEITGTARTAGLAAVSNGETMFVRNLKTSGYRWAVENRRDRDQPTPSSAGPNVDEWVSTPPLTLFPVERPRSLGLPIRETPEVPWETPSTWANVRCFRDVADPDDTASFQRAIDSGAKTIYFPAGGNFFFSQPVQLRGAVQQIVGMFSNIHGVNGKTPVWRLSERGPTLVVQDLVGGIALEHAAARTLVVKNGQGTGGTLSGGGDLFLDNVVADWEFIKGNAWARQFNNEREGTHILNAGANLWILGLKTERGGTLIETRAGGATELLGGLSYTTTQGKLAPMFVSKDARVSYVLGEVCYSGDPYTRLVQEQRGGVTKTLPRDGAPLRPAFLQGSQLPLYVGQPAP